MIGILLASHGKMAAGMKDSIEMILGEMENFDTVSLKIGQDIEEFRAELGEKIHKLNQGEGVLVFVDLFGASPFNASMYQYNALGAEGIDIRVITGMNLPMVMEAASMRDDEVILSSLADVAIDSGGEGIQEAVKALVQKKHDQEDDEGDY